MPSIQQIQTLDMFPGVATYDTQSPANRPPTPVPVHRLAHLRQLRGHTAKLARGLGPAPDDDTAHSAWQERHRARALFLVALAEWDPTLLRRALLTIAPTPPYATSRALLLEAIHHCDGIEH
jgi:hypothetical protein